VSIVPAIVIAATIPEELFTNLGMVKPWLVTLLKQTNINPLQCFGDHNTLKRIVNRLQQLGCKAVNWIVEAKWRSQLMGSKSL
jgi:hypothetical protein